MSIEQLPGVDLPYEDLGLERGCAFPLGFHALHGFVGEMVSVSQRAGEQLSRVARIAQGASILAIGAVRTAIEDRYNSNRGNLR